MANFLDDEDELEQAAADAQTRKSWLNAAGGVTDALTNVRSASEIALGQGRPQNRFGDSFRAAAENVGDPMEKKAKAMAYLKAKRENAASEDELSPDSNKAKAAKMFFSKRGKQVDPGMSYKDVISLYGNPAEYDKFEFEEGERRKTAQIKGRQNAPKGFQYQMDPATGEMVLTKSTKTLPAETALKVGNILGAAKSSGAIEQIAGTQPTGKWEAFKDWGKELIGVQDQDRAKFSADVASRRNEVMNQIAGANVTADEKGRVLEGIPTRTDAPDQFQGKAKSTTDGLIAKAEAEIEALEGAGYDASDLKKRLAEYKYEISAKRSAKPPRDSVAGGSPLMPSANAAPDYSRLSDDELAAQYNAKVKGKK